MNENTTPSDNDPRDDDAPPNMLTRRKTITYRWWRDDNGDIEHTAVEFLDQIADGIIGDMLSKGFTSGEMNATPTDSSTYYRGYWEVT